MSILSPPSESMMVYSESLPLSDWNIAVEADGSEKRRMGGEVGRESALKILLLQQYQVEFEEWSSSRSL